MRQGSRTQFYHKQHNQTHKMLVKLAPARYPSNKINDKMPISSSSLLTCLCLSSLIDNPWGKAHCTDVLTSTTKMFATRPPQEDTSRVTHKGLLYGPKATNYKPWPEPLTTASTFLIMIFGYTIKLRYSDASFAEDKDICSEN